jgi:hypothetical protein
MENYLKKIVKYLLILVIILNSLSLLLPWGTYDGSGFGRIDFYSWGSYRNSIDGSFNSTLYVSFLNLATVNSYLKIDGFKMGIVPILFSVLLLFFIVLALAISIGILIKQEYNKKYIIILNISAIFSIISFYIFIQFGMSSIPQLSIIPFNYSTGFYLVILSICILSFSYFLFDFFSMRNNVYNSKTKNDETTSPIQIQEKNLTNKNFDRRCPHCGRVIPDDAIVCPYCAMNFSDTEFNGKKKHSGFGTASLILGIIALCLIWLTYIPPVGVLIFLIGFLPVGVLTVIFGSIGYWYRNKDKLGIAGFILGVLVLILGLIGVTVSAVVYI